MNLVHMSGAGNVFLVGDARQSTGVSVWSPSNIRKLIALHHPEDGQLVEGVMFLTSTAAGADDVDFTADFYNPDGSHGMMCGNGARCIVRFYTSVASSTQSPGEVCFTLNGIQYHADVTDEHVTVHFPPPLMVRKYGTGSLAGVYEDVWYVDVNSDHVVCGGPLDASRPIVQILRNHAMFPRGVNVNMIEQVDATHANIATFERGVEAVTGACGTGALSAAIALMYDGNHKSPFLLNLMPPSGRPLTCKITTDATEKSIGTATIVKLSLTGDARFDSPFFEA